MSSSRYKRKTWSFPGRRLYRESTILPLLQNVEYHLLGVLYYLNGTMVEYHLLPFTSDVINVVNQLDVIRIVETDVPTKNDISQIIIPHIIFLRKGILELCPPSIHVCHILRKCSSLHMQVKMEICTNLAMLWTSWLLGAFLALQSKRAVTIAVSLEIPNDM